MTTWEDRRYHLGTQVCLDGLRVTLIAPHEDLAHELVSAAQVFAHQVPAQPTRAPQRCSQSAPAFTPSTALPAGAAAEEDSPAPAGEEDA